MILIIWVKKLIYFLFKIFFLYYLKNNIYDDIFLECCCSVFEKSVYLEIEFGKWWNKVLLFSLVNWNGFKVDRDLVKF